MTKEQINFLLSTGYSLDEIMQMQPAPAEDPKPAPAEDPKPAPAEDSKPAPAADPTSAALLAAVQQLTQAVQLGNIRGTGFPAPQPDRTVDDILGEIINPPTYQPKH